MADTAHRYQKLPGRGLRYAFGVTATRCRLWLGDDHLLAVDSTLINEEYRRFYFCDIEAFIIRQTARRQIINWVFVVLALITASPFLIAWNSERTAGPLMMAVLKAQTDQVLSTVSEDQIELIGNVGYQQPSWYEQTAGVQEFNYSAKSWCAANIDKFPLLLLSPQATNSYKVLVQESLGGFKIKIYHSKAFPWGEVFKMLLYRDFRVYVTRHKADIYIDANA